MSIICKGLLSVCELKIGRQTQKQPHKTRSSLCCGYVNGKLTIILVAIAKELNLASLCYTLTSKYNVVYLPCACYRDELGRTHFN